MGGKSSGVSQSTQNAEVAVAQGELALGQQANQRAQQLFTETFPGLQQSENYYQQLASGDPAAIARAISPAVQQINQQAQGTKERISQDVPRGGQQNLALAENEVNKGAQIGQAATQGYLNSFQNLSALAGQGVGEAGSFTNSAIGGLSAAGNQYSNLANQQAEGKASQLGFISSLAGSGAEVAGAFCWIAEAYWGVFDWRTSLVREWLLTVYRKTLVGAVVVWFYRHTGKYVAEQFKKRAWVRVIIRPIFDKFLKLAMEHRCP